MMADEIQNTELEPGAASPTPASPPPAEPASATQPGSAGGDVKAPDPGAAVDTAVKEAMDLLKDGAKAGEIRARDPSTGKFIAKTEAPDRSGQAAPAAAAPAAAAPKVEAPKDSATVDGKSAATEQASTPALKPPTSWSPEAKSDFAKASPAIQAAVLKREAEVSDGFKQLSGDAKAWKGIDAVIAPHRQTLANLGYKNDGEAISRLLDLNAAFQRDPAGTLRQMMQAARIDPRTLAAQTPPTTVPPVVAPTPAAASLTPAQIEAQIQSTIAKREASTTIAQFEADPKHPHAKEPAVKRNMALALQAGTATNLEEAYQAAVFMDPRLREQVLKERTAAAPNPAQKVAAARSAAVSLRGSAPNGAASTGPTNFTGSAEDAVRQAIAQLSGRA